MNNLLLILGLTVLYYIVLFYLDNKKRTAFKLAQKRAIGETTPLPSIEIENPSKLFGEANLATPAAPLQPSVENEMTLKKLAVADNNYGLEKELEELALDLEAEQTFETPTNNLIGALAATAKDSLNEKDISRIVANISKPIRR